MVGDNANFNRGMNNIGVPVLNNQSTLSPTQSSPISPVAPMSPLRGGHGEPVATPILGTTGTLGTPVTNPLEPGQTILGGQKGKMPAQQAYSAVPTPGTGTLSSTGSTIAPTQGGAIPIQQPLSSTATGATASTNPLNSMTPQQQQELLKQLKDIFGKGEGSLLNSLIGSIGGSDDAYMQAFIQAMQGPNAQNLANLNTTLGNSGISMDSSTAAIANALFQSNVSSEEGLQEQQLKMNDLAQLIGLTQGLQGASASEVSSGGFLNDLASVTSSIGNLIPFGSGGNKGNAGNVSTSGAAAQAGLSQGTIGYEGAPLGEGAIPLSGTDTSTLPDLSSEFANSPSLSDLIGEGVFI